MLSLKGAPLRRTVVPVIGPLDPAQGRRDVADTIWPTGTVHAVGRDRALYVEGDPAANWYRLLSGSLRLVRVLADGRRHVSDFIFPGQFFGFEPGARHVHRAEAIEPASVVVYPCARIEQGMAQDHLVRRAVRNLLVERLSAAQERMLTLGRLDAAERLAAFLLTMARRAGPGKLSNVIDLPMSRHDIADYLGMTVETASRLFTAMRQRGLIHLVTASRVELLDIEALETAAGGVRFGDMPLDPNSLDA